jgi:PAS domain S-box-containing protein
MAKELVSPKDFLENIYDTTPDGIMVSDNKGYIIRVNRALEKMLGFSQEELIGKHTGEMSPNDEKHIEIGMKMLTELRAEGYIKNFEAYWSRKDGSLCPIELNITLLKDRNGNKAGSVAIIRDISERKKSEEALRESDERFRSLIEQANDAIFFVDGSGTIQFWNRQAEELYGYTADEVLGKPHSIIVPQRFQEAHKKWMEKFLSGDETAVSGKIVQGIGERKDGSEFYAETSTAILKQRDEKLLVAIVRDITERMRSEAEMRDAKEFLENVFKTSGDGLMVTDELGYIKKANDKTIKLFGYTEEELLGMHTAELSPNYTDYSAENNKPPIMEQLFEKGFVENYVTEYKKKNGSVFPGEVNIISLRSSSGDLAGGICSLRDITERKSTEERLKDAKEQLEKFIENSLDPIVVSDSSGHVLTPNRAFLEMLGYQESEIIGNMVDSLFVYEPGTYESTTGELVTISEDFFIKNSSWMSQLFKNGKIFNWETYYLHKSRKIVPTTQNITLIYDRNGKISRLFCIIRDLTLQKKAEAELRISEARFRAITESSLDAIITSDDNNTITFCNQAAEKMFGYSKDEMLGQPANILVAENFRDQDKGSYNKALISGPATLTSKPIEVLGLSKNQGTFPVEVSVTTYKIDGKTYFTTTIHNISERKKLEEKIRQSEKMEAIGTLAGGVAHDLNNILSAMVGYPDLLLLNIPEDNALRKPLLSIKSSGEKAAAIVNDLLTLARRGVNVSEVVNLNAIITDYLSSQQHEKLRCYHPRVEFDINLDPEIINMVGSPVHLSKTVMNLISNAAEAMPDGGNVIISTRNMYLDNPVNGYDTIQEGDYVVLSVTDTGSGISPEDLSRIFEPFYTKKIMGRSGTGLGLAVVWGTVQDHNGYIVVDSVPGKGTSFSIYIPATRATIAAKTEALPIERFLGRGEYILVVDDAEPQREIASNILEKLNYHVATVASGEAAVEYVKSKPCDLIVLDMLMDPGIDGLETYKRILSIAPHQKAIIASGFSETEQVKETQRLGAGAYLKKPYTLEEIGMAVKTELAK